MMNSHFNKALNRSTKEPEFASREIAFFRCQERQMPRSAWPLAKECITINRL